MPPISFCPCHFLAKKQKYKWRKELRDESTGIKKQTFHILVRNGPRSLEGNGLTLNVRKTIQFSRYKGKQKEYLITLDSASTTYSRFLRIWSKSRQIAFGTWRKHVWNLAATKLYTWGENTISRGNVPKESIFQFRYQYHFEYCYSIVLLNNTFILCSFKCF